MEVFRITSAEYAGNLYASGRANRWNSADKFAIYTAQNRALAHLEVYVHLNRILPVLPFRIMRIFVPDTLLIESVDEANLPADWKTGESYPMCQRIGDEWLDNQRTAVCQLPSVFVPNEHNYLFNPRHPDYAQIEVVATEPFSFDPRLFEVAA